jgi:tRNA (guanine26-N2/guanine27-N2)-dimethyltransferase
MQKIREGKVDILVPKTQKIVSKDMPVFYNPEGELSRDISVSAFQVFQNSFDGKMNICDALSGTGLKGLRYAKEVKGIGKATLNDRNPSAVKMIKKNIKENKLSRKCIASSEDASLLMRKNVFAGIDLDPFGSPSTFMDSAARSIYHHGFIAVTATDQSALAGTYPESCFRKYGIKTAKTVFYNELGVRILTSFIIQSMARYDRAFVPVLSFADQHYYRVFGRIEHAGKISELLKQFKYVSYCACGNWEAVSKEKCSCGREFKIIGPVYLGPISEKSFCKEVLDDLCKRDFRMKKEELKLLRLLVEEAEMPAFYYDLHKIAKLLKAQPPKMENVIESIKSNGFKVSRTHFSPTAIKTDANYRIITSFF